MSSLTAEAIERLKRFAECTAIERERKRMATPMPGEDGFDEAADAAANRLAEQIYFDRIGREKRVKSFPALRLVHSRDESKETGEG